MPLQDRDYPTENPRFRRSAHDARTLSCAASCISGTLAEQRKHVFTVSVRSLPRLARIRPISYQESALSSSGSTEALPARPNEREGRSSGLSLRACELYGYGLPPPPPPVVEFLTTFAPAGETASHVPPKAFRPSPFVWPLCLSLANM